jgi:hypothetical protein
LQHAALPAPVTAAISDFIGIVGTVTLCGAVALTLYSLALYLRRYGAIFFRRREPAR